MGFLFGKKQMHLYDIYYNPIEKEDDAISFEDSKKEISFPAVLSSLCKSSHASLIFESIWESEYFIICSREYFSGSSLFEIMVISFSRTFCSCAVKPFAPNFSIFSFVRAKEQNWMIYLSCSTSRTTAGEFLYNTTEFFLIISVIITWNWL